MPKPTFKGLPREKKERVLGAATALFAERGFHRTEMDAIAPRAGISKENWEKPLNNSIDRKRIG
jgi:AcrR family transcriptional regulator